MSKKFDVVVLGDTNPDLILTSRDIVPEFGQVEKWIDDAELTIGGSACIFAAGAAKLGLKTAYIGKVGDDDFGRFMRDQLSAKGIDVSGLVIDPSIKTGLGISLSTGNDRAILTYGGSIPLLNYQDIDFDIIAAGRHLHSGSFYLLDSLRPEMAQVYQRAKALGLSTSIDTNYDPKEVWEQNQIMGVLAHTDIFLPNTTELEKISGKTDLESAKKFFTGSSDLLLAVKNGDAGALAFQRDQHYAAESIQVSPVDTTGAGDSFDAGFIFGYLSGFSIEKSLRIGCVCGALSTQGLGGTAAQASQSDLKKYGVL